MPSTPAPIESVAAAAPLPHLLVLNDDCLIAILRHLPTDDLAAVDHTCARLREIARHTFALANIAQPYEINHAINSVVGLDYHTFYPDQNRQQSKNAIEKFVSWTQHPSMKRTLKSFGDLIQELEIHFALPHEHIDGERRRNELFFGRPLFGDILEHCGHTLQRLKVHDLVWTPELLVQARPLLNRLTKLHSFDGTNTALILPELQQARDLSITEERCVAVLGRDWPRLERFAYMDASLNDLDQMHDFLRRHRNLRELHMAVRRSTALSVSAIIDMHRLEELQILGTISLADVDELRFDRLTKLTLRDPGMEISLLLQCLVDSVTVTTLLDLRIEEITMRAIDMAALSRFTKLERIHLQHINTPEPSLPLHITNMPHLKELHLRHTHCGSYHLAALPSLHTLALDHMTIDGTLIDAIAQLAQLKCLKLQFVTWMPNTSLQSLRSVQRLHELEMEDCYEVMANFLNYLGATASLRSLKIGHSDIDDDIIRSFDRYRNLQRMKFAYCRPANITRLRNTQQYYLWTIKELHLDYNQDDFDSFLLNVESVDTLVELQIFARPVYDYDATLRAISRYRNLRELTFDGHAPISDWRTLGSGLDHLRKLALTNTYEFARTDPFQWSHVFELIDRLESVETLVLYYLFSYEPRLVGRLIDELQRICQQQKCQVNIGIFDQYRDLSLSYIEITFGNFAR